MSYLFDEIKEKYRDRIDPGLNKWTIMRNLQDKLEEKEFSAEEIQLMTEIIIDIVNKHGGSKEEVFQALYKGYRI